MAAIRIIQDNKVNGWELLSVHNPLVFICELDYSGITPSYVDVKLSSGDDVLFEGKAITYKDSAPMTRQYIFVADAFIRANMLEFDDVAQASDTLIFIENITKEFTITFSYDNTIDSVNFVACTAASQFGDINGACMIDVNEPKTYTAGQNGVVYLYLYNWDENNYVSMSSVINYAYAQNSNLDDFTNNNGDKFLISI